MKKIKPFTNDHALQSSFKPPLSVTEDSLKNWIDKQELLQMLHISERTLQNLRSKNIIPWSAIGGKVYYYLPGILQVLHNNIRNKDK